MSCFSFGRFSLECSLISVLHLRIATTSLCTKSLRTWVSSASTNSKSWISANWLCPRNPPKCMYSCSLRSTRRLSVCICGRSGWPSSTSTTSTKRSSVALRTTCQNWPTSLRPLKNGPLAKTRRRFQPPPATWTKPKPICLSRTCPTIMSRQWMQLLSFRMMWFRRRASNTAKRRSPRLSRLTLRAPNPKWFPLQSKSSGKSRQTQCLKLLTSALSPTSNEKRRNADRPQLTRFVASTRPIQRKPLHLQRQIDPLQNA